MNKFKIGDLVYVKAFSGSHIGEVVQVKPGFINSNGALLYIRLVSSGIIKSFADCYCSLLDAPTLDRLGEMELNDVKAKYTLLHAMLKQKK